MKLQSHPSPKLFVFKLVMLIVVVFLIIIDIFFLKKANDAVTFSLLIVYIGMHFVFRHKSKYIFSTILLMLIIMFISLLSTGASTQTEKAAVWIYLLLFFAIAQRFFES